MKMFSCGGAGIYLTKHILFMEKEVHKIMLKVGVLHAPKPYVLKCPPQGLMSIAAYLRENKIIFDILDANIHFVDCKKIEKDSYQKLLNDKLYINNFNMAKQDFPEQQLTEYFLEHQFEIVLVDCNFTGTANYSFRTIQLLRRVLPNCIIITGGIHATIFDKEILDKYPVNIVIKGEGEEIALKIIRGYINHDIDLADIAGISYKENGRVISNAGSGLVEDINTLPPVYNVYEDFEIELYRDYVKAVKGPFWGDQDPTGVLLSSRGCVGRCTFCNGRVIDQGRYRSSSVENIIKQIDYLYTRYKPKKFGIYDAMFGGNLSSYKAVCDYFRQRKVPWGFETRIDIMTEEKLDYLKNTNCKYILYGLESVSLDTLIYNHKVSKATRSDYEVKAAKLFKKTSRIHILCVISILYGLPGDDANIFNKTIRFFKEHKLNNDRYITGLFYSPIMYPGTDIWNNAKKEDRCYNWDKFFVNNENIIEEGQIIYKNPNIDLSELNHYVKNSFELIQEDKTKFKLINKLLSKQKKIRNLWAEGKDGLSSLFYLKWFLMSILYS